ncbi:hypothetical protein Droror1_Dr00013096 [Drosera rotundifolia]
MEDDFLLRSKTLPAIITNGYHHNAGGHRHDDCTMIKSAEPEEEPLSPLSHVFLSSSMNTTAILVVGFATTVDVEEFTRNFESTWIKHPRFSSKLVFDANNRPNRWIRTKVNLEDHIIVPDFDPNMDNPDRFVQDYISDLSQTPIDLSKPLWEFHILNITTSHGNAVGTLKMHHSLGDGISVFSLLLSCSRKITNPEELPSFSKPKKPSSSNADGCFRNFIAIWLMLKLMWNTLIDLLEFLCSAVRVLKDSDTPVYNEKGVGNSYRRIVHRMVSLDDMKLVKNETKATINDVFVGIINAALSRYLHRKHGEFSSTNGREEGYAVTGRNSHMKGIHIRASVLVNLRQTAGVNNVACMLEKGSKCKWGNRIGCMLLPLHVALEKDPLEYIHKAKQKLDRKKSSLQAKVLNYLIIPILQFVLGNKVASAVIYRAISSTTMVVSNVVGPAEEVAFCGQRVAFIASTVCMASQGLIIHCTSCGDKMSIVLCASPELIPDLHRLGDDIVDSLEDMKDVVLQRKHNDEGII